MQAAYSGRVGGTNPPRRPFTAACMRAISVLNVYHAISCMLLAVNRVPVALDREARYLLAGAMGTTPATDVYHVVRSMLPAIRPPLAAFEVEVRLR